MDSQPLPPRGLIRGVAIGLLLMAVFSAWWASGTFYGWTTPAAVIATTLGAVAAAAFIVQSVRLFRASRRLPLATATPGQFTKQRGRVFGWVFGAEGVLIGVAAVVLSSTGLDDFVLPTIAVIVGVHFFPMGWIFQRSIDVWLASWTTLVGIAGIIAVAMDRPDAALVWSWVGAGVALATLSYGVYMLRYGARLLRLASGPAAV